MTKQITKIELDGKIIGTKPLLMNDDLISIREKIKQKVNKPYLFLDQEGNIIEKEDEKDYLLENINNNKIIRIKSIEDKNESKINVILNDKDSFHISAEKSTKLDEARALILKNNKDNFFFLDSDENTVEKDDEIEYTIEDILNNGEIKIKSISLNDNPPATPINNLESSDKKTLNTNQREKEEISLKKENKTEESKLIAVYVNGNQLAIKKLNFKDSLDIIRTNISDKISDSTLFTLESGNIIDISDESGILLEDILIDKNKINMVSKKIIEKAVPLPDAKFIENAGKLKIYQYPNVKLSDIEESSSISLLVVGQTGSGKTTLLNAFINALMGIKITDDFRYKIIIENFNHSQAFSMTDDVNIYNIKPHGNNPAIKIIDTPGFGDTRGIAQDKIIRDKIADTFKNKLNTINAICFVAQSSNARLTANQKYIFTSILDLFGKDVQENFVAMLTFCDGKEPQIVAALKEKDSIFDKIIPHIKGNWYYKFNNSAIYSDDVDDEFTQMFWKLGMKSFEGFISQLLKIPRKSLTQSKEVLKERQSLENSIKNLSDELQRGLVTMESIRQTLEAIQNAHLNLNASKGFVVKTKVTVWKSIDAPVGQYTTTCQKCNRTCHDNCSYGPGESKLYCCAMRNGYCTECPGKCHHEIHKNLPILWVSKEEENTVTDKDLEKRYYDSKSKLTKEAQYINGLKNDFNKITLNCLNTQEKIKNSVDKLKMIALNSNSYESSEEYIDLLIESEKSEKKKGYQQRIKGYEELKKQHQILREAYKNENSTAKSFEQFKNEFLEKEQKAKKDENCSIF